MRRRLAQLSEGELVVLIGGVLLIFDLLVLPWHSVDIGDLEIAFDTTRSGVQSPFSGYGVAAVILTAMMVLHVVAARLLSLRLPDRMPWAVLQFVAGVFVAVLLIVKLLRETEFLGYGAYSGVLGGLLVAYGGYRIGQQGARPA